MAYSGACVHRHGKADRLYGDSEVGSCRTEEELAATLEHELQGAFREGRQACVAVLGIIRSSGAGRSWPTKYIYVYLFTVSSHTTVLAS